MDPVDAFAINSMKFDWALDPHTFGYDLTSREINVLTSTNLYIYPLRIIGTVSRYKNIDTVCWAWNDHPSMFPPEIIYNGVLRSRVPQDFENRDELYAIVLREAIDLPGIIYRYFPGDNINIETSDFILFYLE